MASQHPRLVGVASCAPPHAIDQAAARRFAAEHFAGHLRDLDRLLSVFDHAGVERRRFCVSADWFRRERSFAEKNALYIEASVALASEAVTGLLGRLGLSPGDVQHLLFVSSTGLATPSIDARLIGRLGLSPGTKRLPIWGLGCAGGALGLGHAAEVLQGRPDDNLLLVNVELCGLTFQHADRSKANLVATALFSDGATAALLAGAGSRLGGAEVLAWKAHTWPDSLDVMGWDFTNHGMQVVFSQRIPAIVRDKMGAVVREFTGEQGLRPEDVDHFLVHPGGAKVVAAYEEALGVSHDRLALAREVLREHGNCSSCAVMLVLEEFLRRGAGSPGDLGLVTALGPGFSAGSVLLRF